MALVEGCTDGSLPERVRRCAGVGASAGHEKTRWTIQRFGGVSMVRLAWSPQRWRWSVVAGSRHGGWSRRTGSRRRGPTMHRPRTH